MLASISAMRTCARACASPLVLDGNGERQLAVGRVGVIAAQIAVEPGGALDRPRRSLVEGHLAAEKAGRHQTVEVAVGALQHGRVGGHVLAQFFQLLAEPRLRNQVAAQPARNEQPAQEAAPGQPSVDLLGALLEQLSLGIADLQRRRIRQVPEIVQVVVETFELGQQRAQQKRAPRHGAAGRMLDGLAEGKTVREAADAGDALGEHDGASRASAPRTASPCRDA